MKHSETISSESYHSITPEDFGKIVAESRKERGWSQQELGKMLTEREGKIKKGESARVIISRIENCTNVPSEARMNILCDILGIDNAVINPDTNPVVSFATNMAELTKICSKLSPIALDAVIAYAKKFAQYGKDH